MRMPFEHLMEYAAGFSEAEWELSLGELAGRVDEKGVRLADAVAAVKLLRALRPGLGPADIRGLSVPFVHQVILEDESGLFSGSVTSPFTPEENPGNLT
jgi:hypothetical protein